MACPWGDDFGKGVGISTTNGISDGWQSGFQLDRLVKTDFGWSIREGGGHREKSFVLKNDMSALNSICTAGKYGVANHVPSGTSDGS